MAMSPLKSIFEWTDAIGTLGRIVNNFAKAGEAQSVVVLKDSLFDVEQKEQDLEIRRQAFKAKMLAAPVAA